jgi:hypothetical protein
VKGKIGIVLPGNFLTSRRDNPTVSRRVLSLADTLGQRLERQSASLEAVLRGGGVDIVTTKRVKNKRVATGARL